MNNNALYKAKYILLLLIVAGSVLSCKKNREDSNRNPLPLGNITVRNINEGAEISYDTPDNEDIILVTAQYKTDAGETVIKRFDIGEHPSSLVLSSLPVGKRKVELFTVNNIGNTSSIVEVEIDPLESLQVLYLNEIINSVELNPVLGGISIDFDKNTDQKSIYFMISYKDGSDTWVAYDKEVKSDEEANNLVVSGLSYSQFKLFITDNSDISLTKDFVVTPIVERKLDKSTWSSPKLPLDKWQGRTENLGIELIWDDQVLRRFEPLVNPAEYPASFTIDLGANQNLKLSSIRVFPFYYEPDQYWQGHIKTMEIYGSNNPDADGGWANWTKLADFSSYKPSGRPAGKGQRTAEDLAYAQAGEEIRIPDGNVAVYRWVRFKVINTWNNNDPSFSHFRLQEVDIWGIE